MDTFSPSYPWPSEKQLAREAVKARRESEYELLMKPMTETLTLLRETAVELHRRAGMIPWMGASADAKDEAERIKDAISDAEKSIRRSIRDAVQLD